MALPRSGCCKKGMWHDVQRLPSEPGAWWVCAAARAPPLLGWHDVHCRSSKRPSSGAPFWSRYFCVWGSWHDVQVMLPALRVDALRDLRAVARLAVHRGGRLAEDALRRPVAAVGEGHLGADGQPRLAPLRGGRAEPRVLGADEVPRQEAPAAVVEA